MPTTKQRYRWYDIPPIIWGGMFLGTGLGAVAGFLGGIRHGLGPAVVCALFFGFPATIVGFGFGSLLHAPKWAAAGAVLATLPWAAMFALILGLAPPQEPAAQDVGWAGWVISVLVLLLPGACGAGIGACLLLLREQEARRRVESLRN